VNVVTVEQLGGRALAAVEVSRPMRLVDLTGAGCVCAALFSRTRRHVVTVSQGGLLEWRLRPLLGATLRRYGFSLRAGGSYAP
jgi:hypothetical protein